MTLVFAIFTSIFGFFTSKLKWILIIGSLIALLGGLGYIAYLKYEVASTAATIEDLATQRDTATLVAKQNAAAIKAIMAHDLAVQAIVSADNTKIAALQEIVRNAEMEIAKSPTTDNGPLAPVLRNALKRLRELDAAIFTSVQP